MSAIHLLLHLSFLSLTVASNDKVNGHLIVSSIMNPLAAIPNTRTYNKGLIEKDLLDLFAKTLNFTYEVRPPKDVLALGVIRNGTGALGQLMRREVDVYVSGAERTLEKERFVETSFPYFFENTQIMIRYPEVSHKSSAFYSIYSTKVWVWTLVIVSILTAFMHYLVKKKLRGRRAEPLGLLIIGLFTNQGVYFTYRSPTMRIMWGVLCLTSIVLVYVYTGTLTSRLTAPFRKAVVDSVDDVANNERLVPYVVKMSAVEERIQNSHLRSMQTIKKRLEHNPTYRIPITEDPAAMFHKGPDTLLMASEMVTKGFIMEDARQFKKCRFTLAKEPVFTRHLCYLFPKGSPLTEIFNKQILLFQQNGLLEHLSRKYIPDIGQCSLTSGKSSRNPVALNLSMLWALFMILALGLTLSLISFMFSLYWNNRGARVSP